MSEKIDLLFRIVDFHEDVAKMETDFTAVINSVAVNVPGYTLKTFEDYFQKDFVDHFKFEEMVVFPAIVAWVQEGEVIKIINAYKKIHNELLETGRNILDKFVREENKLPKENLIEIATSFVRLNKKTCIHASHEEQYIVPLVQNNSTIRFLTGRNAVSYQEIYKAMFKE